MTRCTSFDAQGHIMPVVCGQHVQAQVPANVSTDTLVYDNPLDVTTQYRDAAAWATAGLTPDFAADMKDM